jgi:hypothetical protein
VFVFGQVQQVAAQSVCGVSATVHLTLTFAVLYWPMSLASLEGCFLPCTCVLGCRHNNMHMCMGVLLVPVKQLLLLLGLRTNSCVVLGLDGGC